MGKYEEAKEIAKKLVELEVARKSATEQQKLLKDELMDLIKTNNIDSYFEFNDGIVFVDSTTSYKVADGLKEETEVTSKSPEKLSPDLLENYFTSDIKLNKQAKVAIQEGDTDLLSLLYEETKEKIAIKTK